MKKFIAGTLLGISILISQTGCGSPQSAAAAPNAQTSPEAIQANENDQELSLKEKEKKEKVRREEIAKQYSVYEEFGMKYDKQQDMFFFNEKVVRYFSDSVEADSSNAFFNKEGMIDVIPERNTTCRLTGLKQASNIEFAERTANNQSACQEVVDFSDLSDQGSFELGDSDASDDTLAAYKELGVAYDDAAKQWFYSNKPIHLFYDKDEVTYMNYSDTKGINIKVVRNAKGTIENLTEMTEAEVAQVIH